MNILAQSSLDIIKTPITGPTAYGSGASGIIIFFTNIVRLVFVVAGIYAFLNFIIAGYQYMSAGGDAKALQAAWGRIWQTLIGLVIVVTAFLLTSLVSYLLFGNATYILNPQVYGPGQ